MNLVIQGPSITLRHVETLAKMTGAAGFARLGGSAFRLTDIRDREGVVAYCDGAELDFGFVAPEAKLADIRLVAFDMDSTVITIECVDELGALAGKKDEVAAITAAAMRGDMAFGESLRRRVALLAGLNEKALKQVYEERLQLTEGVEQLMARLKVLGAFTLLVSGGFTYFTDRLKKRLGFDRATSNTLEIVRRRLTGRLKGELLDAAGKAAAVREAREKLKLHRDQILAIGDGANDIPMMAEAGTSIAYRAKPLVREKATYCLNYVGLDGVLNLFP
ncbi:MAG: phosphoserine phosphatase SerB [Betaproteobacteria bacterium]|nr:phosphoserine phosphatase SerB [Betaproteobacteria bacterium]